MTRNRPSLAMLKAEIPTARWSESVSVWRPIFDVAPALTGDAQDSGSQWCWPELVSQDLMASRLTHVVEVICIRGFKDEGFVQNFSSTGGHLHPHTRLVKAKAEHLI
ncbi:unnamed protein product [Cuscuta europaea]|uniref:Uncharacterized protein n=1 Tax=Cuscuta europaea TaxID=41803 RepID=A0A9P0ZZ98_CUSEU|nr:unnamed protein product [Cuscuta europaea]